jgi:hypothetical protein
MVVFLLLLADDEGRGWRSIEFTDQAGQVILVADEGAKSAP